MHRPHGLLLVAALLTASCAGPPGDDGTGTGATGTGAAATAEPTTAATAEPTAEPSEEPVTAMRLLFSTGGGCYDTAEPSGCGDHPPVEVADADDRVAIAAAAADLAAIPLPVDGCGDEYVDGVSRRVVIEVTTAAGTDAHPVCLSSVPDDDPVGALLLARYREARGS